MDRKHVNKSLEKYIKHNNIRKFKSYVKRHDISIVNLKFKHGNSLLHIACKYGSDVIIRRLLKYGADVLLPNKVGQLPIHLACQFAAVGQHYVETDVILPLVKISPRCLDVADHAGCTGRQLLQDFKDRMKQQNNADESESDLSSSSSDESTCSDLEEMWHQKLQQELNEDEFSGSFEQYCASYDGEQHDETYDSWADRLSSELASRRRFNQSSLPSDCRRRHKPPSRPTTIPDEPPKIDEHKRREFERKMLAAQKKHAHHLTTRRKLKYEYDCTSLYKGGEDGSSTTLIGFDQVPWPCVVRGHDLSSGGALRDAVVEFLFGDLDRGSAELKSYLRVQRVRWHPDRFMQRCRSRLMPTDCDRIASRVNEISQILNEVHRQLEHS